jgi:flap endonuclease-1
MGIKSLTKLIKDKSPESIKTDQLHNLSGKKVAIDASLILYQCLLNVRNKGSSLKNDNDKVTSHINGIFYKVINYLSLNIEPIFIFDGKPPEEKDKIIKERQAKAKTAKDNIVNAKTIEEKNKLEKKSIRLTSEHIDDIKKLLSLMGEAIASELCRIGYVDYVITEDMDSLVFGCPKLIRNCLDKNIKRKDIISIIDLENIKKDLNITQERFIELCILCGCDYLSNINKIGQSKALQIINKYEKVEDFINSKHKYNIPEDYITKFYSAKKLFQMYYDKLNPETLPFVKSNINKLELEKYLINECSISEKRVINALKKIENTYK